MEYEFHVGDRVIALEDLPPVRKGDTGTVCSEQKLGSYVRIRWDNPHNSYLYHSCGGNCEPGRGYNLQSVSFKLLEYEPNEGEDEDCCGFVLSDLFT